MEQGFLPASLTKQMRAPAHCAGPSPYCSALLHTASASADTAGPVKEPPMRSEALQKVLLHRVSPLRVETWKENLTFSFHTILPSET